MSQKASTGKEEIPHGPPSAKDSSKSRESVPSTPAKSSSIERPQQSGELQPKGKRMAGIPDILASREAGEDGFIDLGCIGKSSSSNCVAGNELGGEESSSDSDEELGLSKEDEPQNLQDEKELRDLFVGLLGGGNHVGQTEQIAVSAAEIALLNHEKQLEQSTNVDNVQFSDIFSDQKVSRPKVAKRSLNSLSWQKYVSPNEDSSKSQPKSLAPGFDGNIFSYPCACSISRRFLFVLDDGFPRIDKYVVCAANSLCLCLWKCLYR